eukprot:TRINITY_DN20407_c0_g1_i1.p1 TRINITY_DN20407_c0_g1~~TRINITY_DN20407_c0_g1_i1.p1  ORF type:complete len:430 (+),score=128.72 TRINITY_DN20407_c0_g1_i1:96-1292(+)
MSEASFSLPPSMCIQPSEDGSEVPGGHEPMQRPPSTRASSRPRSSGRGADVAAPAAMPPPRPSPPAAFNPLCASTRRQQLPSTEMRLRIQGSLKDRIYQRSFALRKLFRKQSGGSEGMKMAEFLKRMKEQFALSEEEVDVLRDMTRQTDCDRSGTIDFKEFCDLLKRLDRESNPEGERREKARFLAHGVMDPKMQRAMLRNPQAQEGVALGHVRPANELGRMGVDAPFGVLGDGERMAAMISSYLDMRYDHIAACLNRHDADRDGKLTHDELRRALRAVDPYIFDQEIKGLIEHTDQKRKGLISISEFLEGAGAEYVKNKAARASAGLCGGDPLRWDTAEYSRQQVLERLRQTRPKGLKKAPATKSARLRQASSCARRDDLDRRERAQWAAMPGAAFD